MTRKLDPTIDAILPEDIDWKPFFLELFPYLRNDKDTLLLITSRLPTGKQHITQLISPDIEDFDGDIKVADGTTSGEVGSIRLASTASEAPEVAAPKTDPDRECHEALMSGLVCLYVCKKNPLHANYIRAAMANLERAVGLGSYQARWVLALLAYNNNDLIRCASLMQDGIYTGMAGFLLGKYYLYGKYGFEQDDFRAAHHLRRFGYNSHREDAVRVYPVHDQDSDDPTSTGSMYYFFTEADTNVCMKRMKKLIDELPESLQGNDEAKRLQAKLIKHYEEFVSSMKEIPLQKDQKLKKLYGTFIITAADTTYKQRKQALAHFKAQCHYEIQAAVGQLDKQLPFKVHFLNLLKDIANFFIFLWKTTEKGLNENSFFKRKHRDEAQALLGHGKKIQKEYFNDRIHDKQVNSSVDFRKELSGDRYMPNFEQIETVLEPYGDPDSFDDREYNNWVTSKYT